MTQPFQKTTQSDLQWMTECRDAVALHRDEIQMFNRDLIKSLQWLLTVYTEACGIEISEAHPETAEGTARDLLASIEGIQP